MELCISLQKKLLGNHSSYQWSITKTMLSGRWICSDWWSSTLNVAILSSLPQLECMEIRMIAAKLTINSLRVPMVSPKLQYRCCLHPSQGCIRTGESSLWDTLTLVVLILHIYLAMSLSLIPTISSPLCKKSSLEKDLNSPYLVMTIQPLMELALETIFTYQIWVNSI